jgi:hypothetical protein
MRGAIAMSAHMRRGKVAGAGQARSLAVIAGRRLGRARKSTTNLLGLEADIRRGHGGEVEQVSNNLRPSAQVKSGHIGRVRVRLEHAQARRLSGTILGRRANALSVNRNIGPALGPNKSTRGSHRGRVRREDGISSLANSGTHQVNIIAKLVSVGLLLGNSANWGTSARFGRARETTADLLRPKTVDTAAVEGGAEESRGTTISHFGRARKLSTSLLRVEVSDSWVQLGRGAAQISDGITRLGAMRAMRGKRLVLRRGVESPCPSSVGDVAAASRGDRWRNIVANVDVDLPAVDDSPSGMAVKNLES